MKRIVYGMVSSLVILTAALPAMAETQAPAGTQSRSTIEQMFRQQRVLTEEIQTMMAQMKMMMAEMKALTTPSKRTSVTMEDLYKQQQLLAARVEGLIGRTRLDTLPQRDVSTGAIQEIYQQQTVMVAEMKAMMAEIKEMMKVYRGRATNLN